MQHCHLLIKCVCKNLTNVQLATINTYHECNTHAYKDGPRDCNQKILKPNIQKFVIWNVKKLGHAVFKT